MDLRRILRTRSSSPSKSIAKKEGGPDKGARATFLLNQFDEGKLMVLNAMGLKYVVDVDMLEAHDQACEDRKGGKGATDQTYYDKNGVVIWRSKADQAAHMAQKQQQRKP